MRRVAVLDVVGLTRGLLDSMPRLKKWAAAGSASGISEVFPAVTCSAQATYLTGQAPTGHGIVGNGWYFREECEVRFWRQSNHLVTAPKLWELARQRDPHFTCANLFWWFNMYSSADYSVTPRPMYPADGRKIPDIYTRPAPLRDDLQRELGRFPLFDFWGPKASLRSSEWIGASARIVEQRFAPSLTLVYLPHLDYPLQRLGPAHPNLAGELAGVDKLCAELIAFYEERGVQVVVLSEYGMAPVSRPVHLNRILREHGFVAVREELGRELLDPGASTAFAVADHQVAHVYVNDPGKLAQVRRVLESVPEVELVLDGARRRDYGLDHPRAGDLIAVSAADAWFTYYYWLDDRRAPDFARTVDIHRKPGYDPVELFLDPRHQFVKAKIAWRLMQKTLGMRMLMDVIPLDATLVRGSHGRMAEAAADMPVFLTRVAGLPETIPANQVCSWLLAHCVGEATTSGAA